MFQEYRLNTFIAVLRKIVCRRKRKIEKCIFTFIQNISKVINNASTRLQSGKLQTLFDFKITPTFRYSNLSRKNS